MFKQNRYFDFSLSLIGLICLAPLTLLAYPALRYFIGQPIFFKQKRLGQNGKIFTLYKLRSMQLDAQKMQKKYAAYNEAPWPMFKIAADPRFIKKELHFLGLKKHNLAVGQFLSRSGLDELPQLINILKGEMSLIGPRPLPLREAALLKTIDQKWYQWRHQVKPGIFSLWALDKKHNQSFAYWRKLEQQTLKTGSLAALKIIEQIIVQQWLLICQQIKANKSK